MSTVMRAPWSPRDESMGRLAACAGSLRCRFTLALIASLAIHVVPLAGLAMLDVERVGGGRSLPLTARIAPLAQVAAPVTGAKRKQPQRKSLPQSPLDAATATLPAPMPVEPAAPGPPPEESAVAAAAVEGRAEGSNPEPTSGGRPTEVPIAFPESIELEFDLAKNPDEAPVGRVVHRFERDGARYVIHSASAMVGISALFATGRYVQESRGTLTPQGLQPERFTVRRGRAERTESASFDWASERATLSAGGTTREWTLQAGAQDQLSYLHQLSFLIADPSLPAVTVTNGRSFYSAKIEILRWETVATGMGPVRALKVRSQLKGDSRIDFWLAPDYGNLPVKVRIRDQRGEEVEQVLATMKVK